MRDGLFKGESVMNDMEADKRPRTEETIAKILEQLLTERDQCSIQIKAAHAEVQFWSEQRDHIDDFLSGNQLPKNVDARLDPVKDDEHVNSRARSISEYG